MKTKETNDGRGLDEAGAKPNTYTDSEPPLSADALMRQAASTAQFYMSSAKKDIDSKFGAGYAENHPGLVGAYMNAAALDFLATFTRGSFAKLAESAWSVGYDISTALRERREAE
jgi:hypothetical protein